MLLMTKEPEDAPFVRFESPLHSYSRETLNCHSKEKKKKKKKRKSAEETENLPIKTPNLNPAPTFK